jgi:hypothetical protein
METIIVTGLDNTPVTEISGVNEKPIDDFCHVAVL